MYLKDVQIFWYYIVIKIVSCFMEIKILFINLMNFNECSVLRVIYIYRYFLEFFIGQLGYLGIKYF